VGRFGRFELTAVDGGRTWLDGGAMFGVVPRPVWAKEFPPDEENRIELVMRPLLVTDEKLGRRILIDTGIGDKFGQRMSERLRIALPEGGLTAAVQRAGVPADQITDVILTHLHFDHAGGATREIDGVVRPTFPNATYHLQRRALKWAEHAPEKDRRSFYGRDYEVLAAEGQLHLLDGPMELFEGIDLILSEGHTVGMQLPLIDGGAEGKVLFCGDVIPTRSHIRLPWIMAFDLYPLTTLEEKRLILAQGLEERWILFFEHDPQVAACRLDEEEGVVVAGKSITQFE